MNSASFGKRLLGGIIDFFILFIILFILGGMLLSVFQGDDMDMQSSSFVIMNMITAPIELLIRMFRYPRALGDTSAYYMLTIIFFFIEIIYYSSMEIFLKGGSIGHFFMKMRVCKIDGNSRNTIDIILRSCLKTISRYLFAIPLLIMLFTNKKQALHDLLTKTMVIMK